MSFVHAHPDDEAIFTGGTMARLARAGTPVVLVVATGGELGAIHPSYHGAIDDVGLAEVRRLECEAAATILGAGSVEFLGYHDSGMAGDPANEALGSFSAAPPGRGRRSARRNSSPGSPRSPWSATTRTASTAIPTTSR